MIDDARERRCSALLSGNKPDHGTNVKNRQLSCSKNNPSARRSLPSRSPVGVIRVGSGLSAFAGIVLQKSKVAGSRIFRENMNREEIADSYRLNRVAEAGGEFGARR